MISPTGTGKTVMGSYIMAAMKEKFEGVVLLPNEDLIDKMEEHGLSLDSSTYFNPQKLQVKMKTLPSQISEKS